MEKLDVVNAALGALKAGKTCELVVVAGTAGSSPRGVGAWMTVFADGSQAGTIGGGKIELFALDEARELLAGGQSRLVRYTMGGENSDTGMICGGAICLCYLHLDATQAPLFQEIADVLAYRRIGDFVIDFEPFIASALEGDVAEYHGEESRRTIAGCPGLSLVEEGSKVTYTNAASEIPAAHIETLCPEGLTYIFGCGTWALRRRGCSRRRALPSWLATTAPAR
ncbi:MAG: XdhC family protein [Collinsella sp.]